MSTKQGHCTRHTRDPEPQLVVFVVVREVILLHLPQVSGEFRVV
jgi:hypothetical protein